MACKSGEQLSEKTLELLKMEEDYAVGAFGSLPGFMVSGKGSTLVDVDGRELIDFICMFSATNLGHCHPKLVKAVTESVQTITLANMSTHSVQWPLVAKELCTRLGFDKITPMCTGAEAADTACKIARKWGITHKGIPAEDVLVLGTSENYHGLTCGVWPIMEPLDQHEYGVFSKNITNIHPGTGKVLRYLHAEDFEAVLSEYHGRVAGVIMECFHGLAPTFEEELDFAKSVRQICKKYNVLFISDEVRQGAGKTGKFLSSEWMGPENKPDMVTMGKSISGGAYPASFVLGSNEVMTLVKPYQSASTFAMAPQANAAVLATLEVIDEEKLIERALYLEAKWKETTATWSIPFVRYYTSRGGDMNLVIDESFKGVSARRIARLAYQKGALMYSQPGRVRLGVALTITDEEFEKGMAILKETLEEVQDYASIPGSSHKAEM
ncbi:pyridoxal phosphate-dependent transferase [Dactylonectria estremocensis]|uniref:Ornithine aminotransferase n=1 Tax=Dactylonectria estremocensis TaxID=1079267 RepID=A0A9P9IIB8_9HYPO|nr:pyridoxal phosphate-dependent transferase [Dactylonectria estremocensis]